MFRIALFLSLAFTHLFCTAQWLSGCKKLRADVGINFYDVLDGAMVHLGDGSVVHTSVMSDSPLRFRSVVKLDANGAVVWSTAYMFPQCVIGRGSIVRTDDGGFIVGANMDTGLSTDLVGLVKFDANGVLLWQRTYFQGETLVLTSVMEVPGGGCAFSAGGDGDGMSRIVEVDALGNIVGGGSWINNSPNAIGPLYIIRATDGNMVMLSRGTAFATGFELTKMDINYNVLWHKSYGYPYDIPWSLVATSDGGVVAVGETYNAELEGATTRDALAVKVDGTGAVQWAKAYGSAVSHNFNAAAQRSDGGFYFCGFGPTRGYVVSTNANGEPLWSYAHADTSSIREYGACAAMPDGAALFSATASGFPSRHSWLVRVPADGIVCPSCAGEAMGISVDMPMPSNDEQFTFVGQTYVDSAMAFNLVTPVFTVLDECVIIGVEEAIEQKEVGSIYPVPAHDGCWLELPSGWNAGLIEVYSCTGALVRVGQLEGAERSWLPTDGWSNGCYQISVRSGTELLHMRLLVQHE